MHTLCAAVLETGCDPCQQCLEDLRSPHVCEYDQICATTVFSSGLLFQGMYNGRTAATLFQTAKAVLSQTALKPFKVLHPTIAHITQTLRS